MVYPIYLIIPVYIVRTYGIRILPVAGAGRLYEVVAMYVIKRYYINA